MFWRRRGREVYEERQRVSGPLADPVQPPAARPLSETIEIEPGAPRPASISRVAEELGRRGEEVVELFKEVVSPAGGRAVLPLYLRRAGEDTFAEVETGPWERETVEGVLKMTAVLRGSKYSEATFEVLGAYPVPYEVRFFCGRSRAALLQLDLLRRDDPGYAEACSEGFRTVAERYWGLHLDYDPEGLPRVEEELLSTLSERTGGGARVPILDALVRGFGCYLGEILRRRAASHGTWRHATDWGEGLVLEFPEVTADPVGEARDRPMAGEPYHLFPTVAVRVDLFVGQVQPVELLFYPPTVRAVIAGVKRYPCFPCLRLYHRSSSCFVVPRRSRR